MSKVLSSVPLTLIRATAKLSAAPPPPLLKPATTYHYAVEVDGRVVAESPAKVTTFPDGPADFTACLASCATTGSDHPVFTTIRKQEPALHGGTMRVLPGGPTTVCFERQAADARPVLCVINTGAEPETVALPVGYGAVLLATTPDGASVQDGRVHLDRLGAAWLVP